MTKAAEADAADPEAPLRLGLAPKALRQYEAAVSFERGQARYPDFAPFYAAQGELLLEPERRLRPQSESRARALLEKAVALDGALSQARYEFGKLLLDGGEAEEALPHFEEAVRQAPSVSRFRLAPAEAYRLPGRRQQQREQLDVFRKPIATEQGRRESEFLVARRAGASLCHASTPSINAKGAGRSPPRA